MSPDHDIVDSQRTVELQGTQIFNDPANSDNNIFRNSNSIFGREFTEWSGVRPGADIGSLLISAGAGASLNNAQVAQKGLNSMLDTKLGNNLFGAKGLLNNNDVIRVGVGFQSRNAGGVNKLFRIAIGSGKGEAQSW